MGAIADMTIEATRWSQCVRGWSGEGQKNAELAIA
jgi:hypothetical protein